MTSMNKLDCSDYTTSACTTLDHTHAPHLPCTTSALQHTRLHHIRPALTGLTAEGDNEKQQREQAFLDAKCFEEINNKMVVECYTGQPQSYFLFAWGFGR